MHQNWNAKKSLESWITHNSINPTDKKKVSTNNTPPHIYEEKDTIPITELESLVYKTAQLVDELGQEYIDFFHRAEKELEKAKQNLHTLDRIKTITTSNTSLHLESNPIQPESLLFQAWSATVSRTDIFMSH